MGIAIQPDRVYREEELILELGFSSAELGRARKRGELQYKEPSRGRRVYLGEWLLAWLKQPSGAS